MKNPNNIQGLIIIMDTKRKTFLKEDYVQGFPAYCGFIVENVGNGEFQSRLVIKPEHRQKEGYVHAGVLATMADHTAGYSAYTLVPENMRILTIEFKINYLKPVKGDEIICKSKVISAGKKIIVSESEIYSKSEKKEDLVSKAMVTLIAVNSSN
ncbi:MAG: PaaI family thioesterase [Promethearchaeota archaeon]